ncbi:ADP-ribosylation factor-like protein [Phycisphaeraceae bacterium D3-23]
MADQDKIDRAFNDYDPKIGVLNLKFCGLKDAGLRSILDRIGEESLTSVIKLYLWNNYIGPDGAAALASATHLVSLKTLELADNHIGPDGAAALSRATQLASLNMLDLRSNNIGPDGTVALANATHLASLNSLELAGNGIGPDGADAIALATHLTSLSTLDLRGNKLGPDGATVLANAIHLASLNTLELGHNNLGLGGATALANATHLTSLNVLELGENDIGPGGAAALVKATHLKSLKSLDLRVNKIGADGAAALAHATHLTSLNSLNLSSNKIGDNGAAALSHAAHLKSLKSLNLRGNYIGPDGAAALAKATHLASLNTLDLRNNDLGPGGATALAKATHLASLNTLHLGYNHIGPDGAVALAKATHFASLNKLELRYNQIGHDGARAILDTWVARPDRASMTTLDLRSNGDLSGLLPPEVLDTVDAQALLAAYEDFRDAKDEDLQPLNEAKLLVVGKEAVGKTSLVRYLIDGTPRTTKHHATVGIDAHEQIETEAWTPEGCPVCLNVWDFAGQEMRYGTHRYFLSERCLYLVVLNDRERDDRSVVEWLKTIRDRGGDSPVLVVINQSDRPDEPHHQLDEPRLKEEYPNIVGFLRTSVPLADQEEPWQVELRDALRRRLADEVTQNPALAETRRSVLRTWIAVRDEVGQIARDSSVLPTATYERVCEKHGVVEEAEKDALLNTLHNLGVVVAYGLQRGGEIILSQITLLDPNWLTGAFYTLLVHPEVREAGGVLEREQLGALLDRTKYPAKWDNFILEMMQDEEVGLAFALRGQHKGRYLIPQALPTNQPELGAWAEDRLRFRVRYDLLPAGLISRFIGESHDYLCDAFKPWTAGAILDIDGCRTLLRGTREKAVIEVWVDGPAPGQKRAALARLMHVLDTVHRLYPEAKPELCVPLPEQPDLDVPYKHLKKLEEKKGLEEMYWPPSALREYSVRELLEGPGGDILRHAGERDGKVTNNYHYNAPVTQMRDVTGPVVHDTGGGPVVGVAQEGSAVSGDAGIAVATGGSADTKSTDASGLRELIVNAAVLIGIALFILVPLFAFPFSRWAWLPLSVGALVGVAWIFRRANRFYRLTYGCVSLAAGAAMLPSISAFVDVPSLGKGSFIVESSFWAVPVFLLAAIAFGVMDYLESRRTAER